MLISCYLIFLILHCLFSNSKLNKSTQLVCLLLLNLWTKRSRVCGGRMVCITLYIFIIIMESSQDMPTYVYIPSNPIQIYYIYLFIILFYNNYYYNNYYFILIIISSSSKFKLIAGLPQLMQFASSLKRAQNGNTMLIEWLSTLLHKMISQQTSFIHYWFHWALLTKCWGKTNLAGMMSFPSNSLKQISFFLLLCLHWEYTV